MSSPSYWRRIGDDVCALLTMNQHPRPWHLPLVAALAAGLPMLLGALTNTLSQAVLASLGGLVIIYMPHSNLIRRLLTVIVVLFGFVVSFSLADALSFNPYMGAAAVALITMLANGIARYWQLPPPGRFFFIMLAALAATLPFDLTLLPMRIGWLMVGGIFATALVVLYSLLVRVDKSAKPLQAIAPVLVKPLLIESIYIGLVVGGSLALANIAGLTNPYWVPISCAAVMQGASVRDLRHRKIHRIGGTLVGMALAYFVWQWQLSPLGIALTVFVLMFIIETLIVRHYGLTVVFITPMTLLLAESALGTMALEQLVQARLIDIALGSLIGFLAGWLWMAWRRSKDIPAR